MGSTPTRSTKFVMGLFWIRQTTEGMWRIGEEATVNATKAIIAANDDYYGEMRLAA